MAHQRPQKELLFPTDTETPGESFNHLKQKSKCSKLEPDEGWCEPDRRHVCRSRTGGSPSAHRRTQHEDSSFKRNLTCSKVSGETSDHTVSWTVTQTGSSSAGNTVNPAAMRSVKNKKDAVAERSVEGASVKQRRDAGVSVSVGNSSVKSGPVVTNGHVTSLPYTRHSHSQSRVKEKANDLQRNRSMKTQRPVSAPSSKNNVKTEPWR